MKRGGVVFAGVVLAVGLSPTGSATAASRWVPDGSAAWVKGAGDDGGANYGLVTTSYGLGTYDGGSPGAPDWGEVDLNPPNLPTTNPKKINALSYDFNPAQGGSSGGSPRMVICFSDGDPSLCDSNGELGPLNWQTPGHWTRVDGFAQSDGVNNVWFNKGGLSSCPQGWPPTTWKAIVACHPGATIKQIRIVNDSGWLSSSYTATAPEKVTLDNLRVNGLNTNGP
jgi:hypothetical protein